MYKNIIVIISFLLSFNLYADSPAGANQQWNGPYTIAKVARYHDGSHRTTVHIKETPQTSCEVTNTEKMVTYSADWALANTIFSTAATAQAQNKKVMLLLQTPCDSTYGLKLMGVEILSN